MKTSLLSPVFFLMIFIVCSSILTAQAQNQIQTDKALKPSSKIKNKTASPPSEISTYSEALNQVQWPTDNTPRSKSQNLQDDEKIKSLLQLKDPKPEIANRSWKYTFSFQAESFKALGKINNNYQAETNLNQNNSVILPRLMLGAAWPLIQRKISFNLDFNVGAGWMTQKTSANYPSLFEDTNVRLNISELSSQALLHMKYQNWSDWSFGLGYETAQLNYTLTSSNEFSRSNNQLRYQAYLIRPRYHFSDKWSIYLNQNIIASQSSQSNIQVESTRTSLGLTSRW